MMMMATTMKDNEQQHAGSGRHEAVKVGTVVSDKRDKTRTVTVEYLAKHDKYGKYLKRRAKFHVHDPENTSRAGDRVEIMPCRPISKTVSWRLVKVVSRAPEAADHDQAGVSSQQTSASSIQEGRE